MISLSGYHVTIQKTTLGENISELIQIATDHQLFTNEDDFLITISSISSLTYLQPITNYLENLGLVGLDDNGFYLDFVAHKSKFINGIELIGDTSVRPQWLKEKAMNIIMQKNDIFSKNDILPLVIRLSGKN